MKSLKKLITETDAKMTELRATMKAMGEKAMKEAFKEIFVAYPQVESLRWQQYTPYFNDGDTCEFSVHDLQVHLEGTSEDAGDYEDGYEDLWSLKDKANADLVNVLKQMNELLCSGPMEETLRALFGDHAEITVTPKKITVEEYSHD